MKSLNMMQTQIGLDNLLQGKLAKDWRIYQSEYEAAQTKEWKDTKIKIQLEHGILFNPYENDKDKKQNIRKRNQKMCSNVSLNKCL